MNFTKQVTWVFRAKPTVLTDVVTRPTSTHQKHLDQLISQGLTQPSRIGTVSTDMPDGSILKVSERAWADQTSAEEYINYRMNNILNNLGKYGTDNYAYIAEKNSDGTTSAVRLFNVWDGSANHPNWTDFREVTLSGYEFKPSDVLIYASVQDYVAPAV